jgi:hypothetical protein
MEQIFQIIQFEVRNCYFQLSRKIFHQKVGIGMGQTGSPPQSMALCMFCEKHFKDAIREYSSFILWFRFFDDVRAWLFYNKNKPEEKEICQTLLEIYASNCYHESMILIPEQHKAENIVFLEAKMNISGDKKFHCQMVSKNFDNIMEKGQPKIWSGQDGNSWGNDKAKQKSILIGRFTMMHNLSSSNMDKFKSFVHLLVHYICLGYKTKAFTQALRVMWKKTNDEFFKTLVPHIPVLYTILQNAKCLNQFQQ